MMDQLLTKTITSSSTAIDTSSSPNASSSPNNPTTGDQLFWIAYILKEGRFAFDSLPNKTTVLERQVKIQWITELVRPNKDILRGFKNNHHLSITSLETNLADEPRLSLPCFFALCILLEKTVVYVNQDTRMFFRGPSFPGGETTIVSSQGTPPAIRYFAEWEVSSTVEVLTTTYYQMESLKKPIRAISAYKVSELEDIYSKLHHHAATVGTATTPTPTPSKKLTKTELYASICSFFPKEQDE